MINQRFTGRFDTRFAGRFDAASGGVPPTPPVYVKNALLLQNGNRIALQNGSGVLLAEYESIFTPLSLFTDGTRGLYYDATMSTEGVAVGSPISTLTDLSPNGNNASSSGGSRPTIAEYNGQRVIACDGINDFMNVPAFNLGGSRNIFVAAIYHNLSTGTALLAETGTTINTFAVVPNSTFGSGGSGIVLRSSALGVSLNAYVAVSGVGDRVMTVQGTNGAAGQSATVNVNGTSGNFSSVNASSAFMNAALNLFARPDGTIPWWGYLKSLIILNRIPTDDEQADLAIWLQRNALS